MIRMYQIFAFISIISIVVSLDLKCLESNSHKPEPTPEDHLFGECKNWKKLSCCSNSTSFNVHLTDTPWNGFNYNHCYRISSACRRRFTQEVCLYECDPYLGRWIVKDESKQMRKERYYQIPLCKKDCDSWFEDCKNDFTCRDDWNRGFKWVNKVNTCPEQEKCITFKEMFKTSENFCSKIWDESFKVTKDSENCFSFDFNGENPNKQVSEYYDKLDN